MNQSTSRFLWICLGGAFGTGARYLISGWALLALGTDLPWGTLVVNVLGSFFLSAVMQVAVTSHLIAPTLRLALTTGVLGGFTTYSTFNYETLAYLREGAWWMGLVSVFLTVALCLSAGVAGIAAARWAVGG
ncbi:MAG: fluoride efflux transporter CrcB [Acidobacteriota bacterium]